MYYHQLSVEFKLNLDAWISYSGDTNRGRENKLKSLEHDTSCVF